LEDVLSQKFETETKFCDEFLNLMEVVCKIEVEGVEEEACLLGVSMLNKTCYVPTLADPGEKVVKRSVEVRNQILEDLFDWDILMIDEEDFMKSENKDEYIW
jgi:hypothetical protein